MDALLPALYFGQPIVGYRGRFDPERALRLMEKYQVRNTFLFPTALKMMMKAFPRPRERFDVNLRSIMSAGEAVGTTVFDWAHEALGVTINEMFGQTEMNYIVGNSHALWPAKPGSMGRPYPGHRIAVIDDDGQTVANGEIGEVAMNRIAPDGTPDPVFFLEYFKNPEGTAKKFTGDWCRTGDLATIDADGYLWYQGRADDMFKAAGYRIGPSEIENCLVKHPAVANAAVVPSPDETRGNVVKAFIVSPRAIALGGAGGGHPAARAQVPRALRIPEGNRVHRRVADDDDRQGAAAGAARARARAKKRARTVVGRSSAASGASAARGLRRPAPLSRRSRNARCVSTHTTAGTTVGRISDPNWKAKAIASRCQAKTRSATRRAARP